MVRIFMPVLNDFDLRLGGLRRVAPSCAGVVVRAILLVLVFRFLCFLFALWGLRGQASARVLRGHVPLNDGRVVAWRRVPCVNKRQVVRARHRRVHRFDLILRIFLRLQRIRDQGVVSELEALDRLSLMIGGRLLHLTFLVYLARILLCGRNHLIVLLSAWLLLGDLPNLGLLKRALLCELLDVALVRVT